jgi:transposase-like protein
LGNRELNEPTLAIADGGLGFWAALPEVLSQTKEQLCWLHKTRNVLNKLPKSELEEAVQRLRAIHLAEDKAKAERLAKKLIKEWNEVETTNPIESVFATIRLRTKPMKRFRTINCGVHLVFKLMKRAKTV